MRSLARCGLGVVAMSLGSLWGCGTHKGDGSLGTAATGAEGGACYPNRTCNGGLSCLSNRCVNADPGNAVAAIGFSNPADPDLLYVAAPNTAPVLFFGTKDPASGLPTKVGGASISASTYAPTSGASALLDEQERWSSVRFGDGTGVEFDYATVGTIAMTITTAGGKQRPMYYDLATNTTRPSAIVPRALVLALVTDLGAPLPADLPGQPPNPNTTAGTITVKCTDGTPLAATPLATYVPAMGPGGLLIRFSVKLSPAGATPGMFNYFVPNHPFVAPPSTTNGSIVAALQALLKTPCNLAKGSSGGPKLNQQVIHSAAMASSLLLGPEAGAIVELAGQSLLLACKASSAANLLRKVGAVIDLAEGQGDLTVSVDYQGQIATRTVHVHPGFGLVPPVALTLSCSPDGGVDAVRDSAGFDMNTSISPPPGGYQECYDSSIMWQYCLDTSKRFQVECWPKDPIPFGCEKSSVYESLALLCCPKSFGPRK